MKAVLKKKVFFLNQALRNYLVSIMYKLFFKQNGRTGSGSGKKEQTSPPEKVFKKFAPS